MTYKLKIGLLVIDIFSGNLNLFLLIYWSGEGRKFQNLLALIGTIAGMTGTYSILCDFLIK